MTLQLLHDHTNGPAPRLGSVQPTTVNFRSMPAWPTPGCQRCGNEHRVHVWQLVDPDRPEQGGIIDCGIRQVQR